MPWKSKRLWLVLQFVVTLCLLALLFESFDWHTFGAVYARLPLSTYLMSLAIVFFGQVLYAWRWRVLLRAAGVPVGFGVVFGQYLIGMFVGNFLPSTVGGDVAKVYFLGRTHGYGPITASVILDRMLGFGLAAALAAGALIVERPDAPVLRLVRTALVLVVAGVLVAFGVAAFGTGGLAKRVARFGPRAIAVAERLQRLRVAIAVLLRHPSVLLHATGTVGLYFLTLTLAYRSLIEVMCGRHLGIGETMMVITSVAVMSNLPISINGLGVREQLHAALFAPLGVPKEVAVAVSLLLFSHTLLTSTAGGILWMRTPAAVREEPGGSV